MASTMTSETLALEELRAGFRGDVLVPGDPGYDEARQVWNGMVDKHPAAIARCAGVADVVDAVSFAREHGIELAVRSGGHGVAGTALSEGGLVVDLSRMKGIHVDAAARTARVEAGCTLGDLDRETQLHGLAAPLGVVTETGVAGLTLGGGMGWLRRAHGLACDSLVSATVVTADGHVLTASETENPELLWGLRGGGGNFGVVTSFEFRLHPVGPEVMVVFTFYPGERAHDVLRGLDDFMAQAPDGIAPLAFLGHVPEADAFPASTHGQSFVALLGLYVGDVAEGERVVAPLRELAEPIVDFSGPMAYRDAQAILDEDYPDGRRYYWKSVDLEELTDEVIGRLVSHTADAPSHHSTIDVWFHGGAMGRVDPAATAFGHRSRYLIGVEANWDEPAESDANVAWARDTVSDLSRFSQGGSYLNFPGFFEEGEEQVRSSYGEENYARLVALKTAYDPENLFRLNGNIVPARR